MVFITGKERIEAAFSQEGAEVFPVVIPYTELYIRDHGKELTTLPWWYQQETDIEKQLLWYQDVINNLQLDWFHLPLSYSREERGNWSMVVEGEVVYLVHQETGEKKIVEEPKISGIGGSSSLSYHPPKPLTTYEEIDEKTLIDPFHEEAFLAEGRGDLAKRLLAGPLRDIYPIYHVGSPFWRCYRLFGFEGLMTTIASKPSLVECACQRLLQYSLEEVAVGALLGAQGFWLEECFSDSISPKAYESLSLPFLRRIVEEIDKRDLKSIYYFTGNPHGKLHLIFSSKAHAFSFEEGKKGFQISINEIVEKAEGKAVVLGNLDAIGALQNGSDEEVKEAIVKQLEAGKRNKRRFIMSVGSPITPSTPLERLHLYRDVVLHNNP